MNNIYLLVILDGLNYTIKNIEFLIQCKLLILNLLIYFCYCIYLITMDHIIINFQGITHFIILLLFNDLINYFLFEIYAKTILYFKIGKFMYNLCILINFKTFITKLVFMDSI